MMEALKFLLVASCISVAYASYPTNITATVECQEQSLVAKWNKTDFAGGNVTKLEWNDEACSGFEESDTQVWASTNFSSCKSVIKQDNDTIIQGNTAKLHVSFRVSVIHRVIIYSFYVQCTMARSIHTPGGGVSYNITEKRIFVGNTTLSTDFQVGMDIYRDNNFNQLMPANSLVSSFNPIYIGIYEVNDNELLKFTVDRCFATPSSDRNDGSNYMFFDGKCPIDTSFQAIGSSSSHRYNFKINAFKFIGLAQSVYIHCRLSVCMVNSTNARCAQQANCAKRKRRAVEIETETDVIEEITVTSRKLSFLRATCNEMNCPSYSSCINLDPPVCRCGFGYVYQAEAGVCSKERMFTISGVHFDMEFENDFLDPYSRKFIQLATRIESQLSYFASQLDDNTIKGIKVIRARKGSVVVDLEVIYAQAATEKEAYDTFLRSISKSHTETVTYSNPLTIKPNTPVVKGWEAEAESVLASQTMLILAVVIPVVAVIAMILIIAVLIRRRRMVPTKSLELEDNYTRHNTHAT